MNSIELVFDPYNIYDGEGFVIADTQSESLAFEEIDNYLRDGTTKYSTFIIKGNFCEHFKSYNESIKGLNIKRLSPRQKVAKYFKNTPPEWLTNEIICDWQLLKREMPKIASSDDWEVIIAAWLIPGIELISSLVEWFFQISNVKDFPEEMVNEKIMGWIVERFREIAGQHVNRDILDRLTGSLIEKKNPVLFAREWIYKKSIAPFVCRTLNNPLYSKSYIDRVSPLDIPIIHALPLIFPLPEKMHQEVSEMMQKSVHNIRLQGRSTIEDVICSLNALWNGVDEELRIWLELLPKELTTKAAEHLRDLPGYESSEIANFVYQNYAPPEDVPVWEDLERIDEWVKSYSKYIRSCFFRRNLPALENDPAAAFGRWIKDNFRVSYAHPERGYCFISKRIKNSIDQGRSVIFVLVDALAFHIANDAEYCLSRELKVKPTLISYLFTPLPTITDVCKQAILTGSLPNECGSDLLTSLQGSYKLTKDQVALASNWKDAHRLQVNDKTKLVVYRDNRIDDKLHSTVSYEDLLVDCKDLFPKIAQLIKRFVKDFYELTSSSPLVVLTADHGFTYGPKPTSDNSKISGDHRCSIVNGEKLEHDADQSLTFIDKDEFNLRNSYLALKGRIEDSGTVSNWVLSHGGLLPEEVIIPVIEWFGSESTLRWPEISFDDEALLYKDMWTTTLKLKNSYNLPISNVEISISVPDESRSESIVIDNLKPGEEKVEEVSIPDSNPSRDEFITFVVIYKQRRPTGREARLERIERISRGRQLVEKTSEQEEFEGMF